MKKFVVAVVCVLGFATAQAQEENKKDLFVQSGDVVAATIHFDTGEISQTGYYTNEGKPTGEWLSFNREGTKTAKAQYDNGAKVGTWFFWSADKLTEVEYTDSQIAAVNVWENKTDKVIVVNK